MIIKNATKCPVCNSNIPFWTHLFFPDLFGLECPTCHSTIAHTLWTKITKWSLVPLFVLLIGQLGQVVHASWWIILAFSLSVIVMMLLIASAQLFGKFKIVTESRRCR
jgi:hypothetical protein